MTEFTRKKKIVLLLVAGQLIITLLFFLLPLGIAIKQSFFFTDPFQLHTAFAGWANYKDALQGPYFWQALQVTLLVSLLMTALTMSLGLLLAYLVFMRTKSQCMYKSMLLWPYAIAPAAAAILWRLLYQPEIGWLARALHINYLMSPNLAMGVVILTASWQQCGYNFLFFFTALKAIPSSLLDAAIIDGASPLRRFWQILFPLLSPTSFFLLITNIMYGFFDTFGIIDILTNGGPGTRTTSLVYKIYQDGFVGMDVGLAAAESVLLMLLVVFLCLLQFRYVGKRVHYS